ncbi:MAG: hypothetical protein ABIN55_04505 [Aeromicrobium sp.]
MDYTPIGAGRVLAAFAFTMIVGLVPITAVLAKHDSATSEALSTFDGYGGLVLGMGSVAMAIALIGLSRLAVATKRRAVGRPSRA